MKIIDLSYALDSECMTCGVPWHEKVNIRRLGTIPVHGRNTHSITLGSHTGTHIDAPLHFIEGANGIDKTDLSYLCGKCRVVDYTHKKAGDRIEIGDVADIMVAERMIFRFDWHRNWKKKEFYKDFPYFMVEAAEYLVSKGMKLIAMDTPSPDGGNSITVEDDSPVHKYLLQKGIIIVEYLTNTDLLRANSEYYLMAMPLKIKDCDGAPARVAVIDGII